jgi:hypothetical protein
MILILRQALIYSRFFMDSIGGPEVSTRTTLRLLSYAVVSTFFLWTLAAQGKNSYEGTAVCGMCHKTAKQGEQLKVWQGSGHAQAYKTLLTDEAKAIATEKGVGAPEKAAACLKCHAPAHDVDAALLGKKFSQEDGVQCETCHGPGSAYKNMKVMKDKKLAVEAGLIVHEDGEKFCVTCHNSESPTFKGFKYAEAWEKIKHPVPGS